MDSVDTFKVSSAKQSPFSKCSHNIQVGIAVVVFFFSGVAVVSVTSQKANSELFLWQKQIHKIAKKESWENQPHQ